MRWYVLRRGEVVSKQGEVSGAVVSAAVVKGWQGPVLVKGNGWERECREIGGGKKGERMWGLYGAVVRAAVEEEFRVVAGGVEYVVRKEERE